MTDNLKTTLKQYFSKADKPSFLLISGDLANRIGEPYDYKAVKNLLQPVVDEGVPVYYVMGNHDRRQNYLNAFYSTHPAELVPGKYVQIVRTAFADWYLLDSKQVEHVTRGRLEKEQLNWLSAELDKRPEKPAIMVLHHDPYSPKQSKKAGLEDTEEFLNIIRPRSQVKACIYGHTHRYELLQDPSGIHFINVPSVAYSFTSAPIGWVQAKLKRDGIHLELKTTDTNNELNGKSVTLKWRLSKSETSPVGKPKK